VKKSFTLEENGEEIDLKIESGIPVPRVYRENPINIAAKTMEIGDSIEFNNIKLASRLETALRKLGLSARRRKLPEGKYRVWRTE